MLPITIHNGMEVDLRLADDRHALTISRQHRNQLIREFGPKLGAQYARAGYSLAKAHRRHARTQREKCPSSL